MSIKRLHATSVAIEDNGVAIFGDPGSNWLKNAVRTEKIYKNYSPIAADTAAESLL